MEFDLIFAPDFVNQHQYDPWAIDAFMKEINALLSNSVLLVNTDQNLSKTFRREGRWYDSLWWLDDDGGFIRDEGKSLLENLLAYRNYALAQAAIPSAREIFAEIKADDIVAARDVVSSISSADLVEVLNSVTDWAYDWAVEGWEAKHPVVKITYTRRGDWGEQAMTLEAGISGEQELVCVTLAGQATALQYSENPSDDAAYLHDVP